MARPSLVITEKNNLQNILLVDKEGFIGAELAKKIKKEMTVILASEKYLLESEEKNIFYISYKRKIPVFPDYLYSIIALVYSGKESLGLLPKFIKKAEKDKSTLVVIFNLKDYNKHLVKKVLDSYKNSKVIILGDLFGKNSLDFDSNINTLIKKAVSKEKIEISNTGLDKKFPIYLEDALDGILRVIFGTSSFGQYLIFSKSFSTDLKISRIIQKINPLVKIDFKKNKSQVRELDFSEGEYTVGSDYPIEKRVKETMEEFNNNQIDNSFWETKQIKEKKENKTRNISLKKIIFTLIFIIIFPFIISVIFFILGIIFINSSKTDLSKGNLSSSFKNAKYSKNFFSRSKDSLNVFSQELEVLGQEDRLNKLDGIINLGKDSSSAVVNVLNSILNVKGIMEGKPEGADLLSSIELLKSGVFSLENIKTNDSLSDLGLGLKFNYPLDPHFYTIEAMPSMLGAYDKKTYLVIFQNNMELRPSGGFIGSYGLLTLNKGRVDDFLIHDVYDADGQLKGHFEPPFAVRRYIPQIHWYLRDSNFDIDFTKSASTAAFLLNKEMGTRVDGVIGVDVTFVKNLLKATGPVFVSDYNEKVDENNLYLLAQTHAEKNFFPGSTQKKDFLRSLFNSIVLSFSSKGVSYIKLLEVLSDSVKTKHLLFAFSDNDVQKYFTANNMSSSLWDNRKQDSKIINDFIGINEANVGVNKANYFIKRDVYQELKISDEGSISGNLIMNYKNDSSEWPGGDYKNYLRIILPKGITISSIYLDDIAQKVIPAISDPKIYEQKGFKKPEGLEIEEKEEEGKSVFGFLVEVKKGSLKKVTINYVFPQKLNLEKQNFTYGLKIFKQPGTEEYPYRFSLSYPSSFSVFEPPTGFKTLDNTISTSEILTQDRDFELDFSKK
ncbi:MAG: DUF4012 domain-containing protein [Patescibacteria group bacterium]|nr:DUF4012 domain-containing protein [Patescibacteria group bacterium]